MLRPLFISLRFYFFSEAVGLQLVFFLFIYRNNRLSPGVFFFNFLFSSYIFYHYFSFPSLLEFIFLIFILIHFLLSFVLRSLSLFFFSTLLSFYSLSLPLHPSLVRFALCLSLSTYLTFIVHPGCSYCLVSHTWRLPQPYTTFIDPSTTVNTTYSSLTVTFHYIAEPITYVQSTLATPVALMPEEDKTKRDGT